MDPSTQLNAKSRDNLVSFRDPSGQLVVTRDRVVRLINDDAWQSTGKLLESKLIGKLIGEGKLIETKQIDSQNVGSILDGHPSSSQYSKALEHRPIKFVSYPYEWAPEMLLKAGELT